ncbi:1,2-dihydroxy-3-keto-5-methylthiopentene dioxygenase [Alicyclobacillus fastidiosus]|uniref:Acireductone dioxygenase n=1 Tax=Alicyclobacillus fastidiosus TaxID=392011 RepID=A0ABV5AE26_9BACL|nr:cupin domain-containing protein [Alicyclobacillus fastidiosus]WEH09892.1 cupin domain-containing protein [Alicyclobacillus fastidiosus]
MATIRVRNTGELIAGEEAVRSFLTANDVYYNHWDVSVIPSHLQDKYDLTDEQKEEILEALRSDIEHLSAERGYVKWDLISLSDANPNLEELLKKFEEVHTHTEDEVRAIAAGSGIFVIKGNDGYFDVILQPGDVISVPEGNPHFFTLTDERKVVAVRLFIDPAGWVAHPFTDPSFQKA